MLQIKIIPAVSNTLTTESVLGTCKEYLKKWCYWPDTNTEARIGAALYVQYIKQCILEQNFLLPEQIQIPNSVNIGIAEVFPSRL